MITLEEAILKVAEFCRTDKHFRHGPFYGKELKLNRIFELDDDAWGFFLDYVHPERDALPDIEGDPCGNSAYLDPTMPKVFKDGHVGYLVFDPTNVKREIEVTSALQLHIDPLPA